MKETQFILKRQSEWNAWDRWLSPPAKKRRRKKGAAAAVADIDPAEPQITVDALPSAFRRLCQDLSLARDRHYSSTLVHALHDRVLAAHQRIYGARRRLAGHWLGFLATGLPRLVRREKRFVLSAAALFFLPLVITLLVLQWQPDGIYYLVSPQEIWQYEEMYSPVSMHLGRPRHASDDLTMLMFYISHNVHIDFQCFAGGIAFGLGSVFYLIFNGLMIGATAGHLTQLGYIETFWGFVAGHSAPELIGAVLSGAAGLKIGYALIAPGRRRRLDALKEDAREAVRLLYGAALLTFGAAFIESLWSSSRALPFQVKIGAGCALWAALIAYFIFAGRGAHAD